MEKQYMIFIDAESDGLYGTILSVAMVITDRSGNEVEHFYYGIEKSQLHITEPWVLENVLPVMDAEEPYEPVASEEELLERVWRIWMKYRDTADIMGDVIFPVEAGLFRKCMQRNPAERSMQGPFPFLDLSSMLYGQGIDPLTERWALLQKTGCTDSERGKQHNALSDVRSMIAIWKNYIKGEEKHGKSE